MRTFTANQQTVRDSSEKETYWLLDVSPTGGGTYYFSTVTKSYGGNSYTPKIDAGTFDGLVFNRNRSELEGIAPTEFEFDILNFDDTYTASDLVDAEVLLHYVQAGGGQEETMFQVKFIISDARDVLGKIHCKCDDLIQNKLRGYFPNDGYARELFTSSDMRFGRSKDEGLSDLIAPWVIGQGYPPLPYIYVQNVISLTTQVDFVASSNGSRCQITRDSGDNFSTLEAGRNITITNAAESGNNQTTRILSIPDNDTIELSKDAGIVADTNDSVTITQDLPLYLMGGTTPTYTASEVKSPYDLGRPSTWGSGSFSFTQHTVADKDSNNWKALRPIIMDADKDGTADSTGQFVDGSQIFPVPVKLQRSDLSAKTDPCDAIEMLLEAFGVASGDIDSTSQTSVKNTYTGESALPGAGNKWKQSVVDSNLYYVVTDPAEGDPGISEPIYLRHENLFLTSGSIASLNEGEFAYGDLDVNGWDSVYVRIVGSGDPTGDDVATNCGIELNGSIFTRWDRNAALAMLLNCGNIILDPEESIKFRFGIKTSQKTIDDSFVLTTGTEIDSSTFEYTPTYEEYSDSAEAEWFGYSTEEVSAISTVTVEGNNSKPSGEFLRLNFLNNYENVRRAGRLALQKRYGKKADVTFLGKTKLIDVQVGDVLTINENDYGGNYTVLVDKMHITPDGPIIFDCFVHGHSYGDWMDLNPDSITQLDDDGTYRWEPVFGGPGSSQDVGAGSFVVWARPYLTVGPNTNVGEYSDIQAAINAVVQSRHYGIMLLPGDYSLSTIYLPNRSLTIVGEDKEQCVLKNTDGSVLFQLQDASVSDFASNLAFVNFKIDSQNTTGNYGNLIHIAKSTSKITGRIVFDRLIFDLNDAGTVGGDGDDGISISNDVSADGDGKLQVEDCVFNGGKYGIDGSRIGFSDITRCEFYDQTYACLELSGNSTDVLIDGNLLKDFFRYGMRVSSHDSANISNNRVFGKTGATPNWQYGLYVSDTPATISLNRIILDVTGSDNVNESVGIYNQINDSTKRSVVMLNLVKMTANNVEHGYGIHTKEVDGSQISNNDIIVNYTRGTRTAKGIYLEECWRNTLQSNTINMTNSTADDIGIHADGDSQYNKGEENIVEDSGDYIDDDGLNNNLEGWDT